MPITKANILEDMQNVAEAQGRISRRLYRENGLYSDRQVRNHFGTFRVALVAAGLADPSVAKEELEGKTQTDEYSDSQWITTFKTNVRITTLEELIKFAKVDTSIWEVERWVCNKWEVGAKNDKGKIVVEPLFQVKATFKRQPELMAARKEIERLKADAKKEARIPEPIIRSDRKSGNLLELMIPDLHAGKLAWSKETGYQDYDTPIAIATYRRALDSLLDRASNYDFDKIILGVGNDLLQSDNIQGTTYSGTKVDTDSRFHKTYVTVRKMLIETIEKLRKVAPVEVKLIPGNHDTLSTFTLGDSLECWFHNYEDVVIDNAVIKHKLVEWGKNLLLLTHGHEGKQADYGIWMATEYPEQFGRTLYREIHVGHKHKSALDEKFGVRVRTLSALCPPDAWHSNNNFVGNLRTAEALVFNKQNGLIAQFYHNEV